jgi:hypothetical protein
LEQENAALKAMLRQRPPTDVDVLYKEIALGFFRWLRSFVAPIANKYGIPDVSQHPVRIMLPNFGSHTSARGVLIDILSEAGWKPATQYSAMPEPLANVIGVSTAGRNGVWEPTPGNINPNYKLMFRGAPLINAIRDFHLDRRAQQFYWMLAIDLGGYTTDFGMLGFDLDNYEDPISGVCEGRKRLSTVSFAHGMQELDRMTGQVVGPDKAAHLAELLNDADQRRLETLHRRIYQRQGTYTTYSGLVFRDGAEAAAIDECISGFADDVVRRAGEFLEANQYQEVDCVVLTGGGFYIPLIRDVVCRGLERYSPAGRRSVAHVPAPASENLPPHWRRMESEFVRGATAAGGASIWFDYAKDFGSEL